MTVVVGTDDSAVLVAGVELGGTKCVCTLAYGPDAIVDQERVDTGDPNDTLGALRAMLDRWSDEHDIAALGIASFGPVDLTPTSASYGHILRTSKPGWADAAVVPVLAKGFAGPIAFDTDVNGAALAEVAWGAGRGLADFAYITVGTGVGVGLIVNDRPTRGIGHSEIGHLLVPRLLGDDMPSGCPFHADCVEGLASGTAIKSALGELHVGSIAADHAIWNRVAHAIASLCHALVCTTGPHRIAIGGGVLNRQPHLLARIEPLLRDSLNGYIRLPDTGPYIVAPELGDQAGPLGPIAMALSAIGQL
jgi:fructokinase